MDVREAPEREAPFGPLVERILREATVEQDCILMTRGGETRLEAGRVIMADP